MVNILKHSSAIKMFPNKLHHFNSFLMLHCSPDCSAHQSKDSSNKDSKVNPTAKTVCQHKHELSPKHAKINTGDVNG